VHCCLEAIIHKSNIIWNF